MDVSDLSPESLARLEAKLTADLEMVRKVRALLSQHLSGSPTPASPPVAAPAPTPFALNLNPGPPPPPLKTVVHEIIAEINGPFRPGDVKDGLRKRKRGGSDYEVRAAIAAAVKSGHARVVKIETGRLGTLYETIPPTTPAETPPESPESGPNPPV